MEKPGTEMHDSEREARLAAESLVKGLAPEERKAAAEQIWNNLENLKKEDTPEGPSK